MVTCPQCGLDVEVPADASPVSEAPVVAVELPPGLPVEAAELGKVLSVHHALDPQPRAIYYFGGALVAAGMLVAGWGITCLVMGPAWNLFAVACAWFGLPGPGNMDEICAAAMGVLAVLLGLRIVVATWRDRELCIVLYEEGFVRLLRAGSDICRWADVVWLDWRRILARGGYFMVSQQNGATLHFGSRDLENLEILKQTLEQRTAPSMLKHAQGRYHAGQTLEFGTLRVSQEGLGGPPGRLGWEQVRSVQATDNAIVIRQWDDAQPWAEVPWAEVRNVEVFLKLVNDILASHRDSLR